MALVGPGPFRRAGPAIDALMVPVIKRMPPLLASREIACMGTRFALGRLALSGHQLCGLRQITLFGPCRIARDIAGVGCKRAAASA